MVYFEMTLVNGQKSEDRITFDISANEQLYNYLTCHENAYSVGEDWFDIILTHENAETVKKLCKTDEEKKLIMPNVKEGTIVDILIHHTIGGDIYDN